MFFFPIFVLVFSMGPFPKSLHFFLKFFFVFLAFRLRRSVGGGVVSEKRASNMPCAANVEGFNDCKYIAELPRTDN